jgi:hypothetical protein
MRLLSDQANVSMGIPPEMCSEGTNALECTHRFFAPRMARRRYFLACACRRALAEITASQGAAAANTSSR